MSLEIIKKFDEGLESWMVYLVGELDIYTAPNFKETLIEALDEKIGDIIINGEKLSYIDSTGLGVLISALKKAKENNKNIIIKKIKPNIKKLFDLTSLDKVFLIEEWFIKMASKIDTRYDCIKLSMPNKAEYVNVVRLTSSAIANRMGFNIEEIEDIKVAIAEACTNTIEHGLDDKNENFDVEFYMHTDKLVITVKDAGKGFDTENLKEVNIEEIGERGLGIFIINSLMDEVEIVSDEGKGTEIRMTKHIKDDIIWQ